MPENEPNKVDTESEDFKKAVTAEVEKIAARIKDEERRKVSEKYADYDDLKKQAEGAKTAEERIGALEQEIEKSKREALRARYAADVPEKLRPLLTGSTDEELKAQRDLLIEGESERKKQGNHVPREGTPPNEPKPDELRDFTRQLFESGT